MIRRFLTALAVGAVVVAAAGPAAAQVLTFELTNAAGNVPLGNTVTVAPGGSFTYSAYLVADATAQSQIANQGNLLNAFTKVTQSASTLASGTPSPNLTAWPDSNTNGSTAAVPVIDAIKISGAGIAPAGFGTAGQVGWLLGTFTFTAGSTLGSDTLTIGLKDASGGDIFSPNPPPNGTTWDSIAHSSTTSFVIAGVPEPGTFALAGVAMAGLAALRRRRRSAAQAA